MPKCEISFFNCRLASLACFSGLTILGWPDHNLFTYFWKLNKTKLDQFYSEMVTGYRLLLTKVQTCSHREKSTGNCFCNWSKVCVLSKSFWLQWSEKQKGAFFDFTLITQPNGCFVFSRQTDVIELKKTRLITYKVVVFERRHKEERSSLKCNTTIFLLHSPTSEDCCLTKKSDQVSPQTL